MTLIVVTMLIILGLAAATAGLVVIGLEGRGRVHAPRLTDKVTLAADYLSGEIRTQGR